MKHRNHLICLLPAIVLAAWLIIGNPGSAALTGLGLVVLICPITMGVVMWMLMRQPDHGTPPRSHEQDQPRDRVTAP
jgi:hypothetical protein